MLLCIKESMLVLISNVHELFYWFFLRLNPYVLQKGFTLIGDSVGTMDQLYALLWRLLLKQPVVFNDLSRGFSSECVSLHFYDDGASILILQ